MLKIDDCIIQLITNVFRFQLFAVNVWENVDLVGGSSYNVLWYLWNAGSDDFGRWGVVPLHIFLFYFSLQILWFSVFDFISLLNPPPLVTWKTHWHKNNENTLSLPGETVANGDDTEAHHSTLSQSSKEVCFTEALAIGCLHFVEVHKLGCIGKENYWNIVSERL